MSFSDNGYSPPRRLDRLSRRNARHAELDLVRSLRGQARLLRHRRNALRASQRERLLHGGPVKTAQKRNRLYDEGTFAPLDGAVDFGFFQIARSVHPFCPLSSGLATVAFVPFIPRAQPLVDVAGDFGTRFVIDFRTVEKLFDERKNR